MPGAAVQAAAADYISLDRQESFGPLPPGIDVDLSSDTLSAEMPASKKPKTWPPEHANGTTATAHASEQADADLDGEAVRLFGEVSIPGEIQAGSRLESSNRAAQSSETIQQHLQCVPRSFSNQVLAWAIKFHNCWLHITCIVGRIPL